MIEYTYTPEGFEESIRGRKLVSFVQKFYNQECYVREVLTAVFAQTYSPIEIVIIDDHSTDGTHDLLMRMIHEYEIHGGNHKVVYNRNELNLGVARNAQVGVDLSSGEILVTGDGDDVCLPNRVERNVKAFESFDNVTLVDSVHHTVLLSGERRILKDWTGAITLEESNPNIVAHAIPCFKGAVSAYRRSALLGFAELTSEDWGDDIILSYRACLRGNVVHIDEPLIYYRTGAGISTGRTKTLEKSLKVNRGRTRCFEQLVEDIKSLHRPDLNDAERIMSDKVRDGMLFLDALGGTCACCRVKSALTLLMRTGFSQRNLALIVLSVCPLGMRKRLYQLWGK